MEKVKKALSFSLDLCTKKKRESGQKKDGKKETLGKQNHISTDAVGFDLRADHDRAHAAGQSLSNAYDVRLGIFYVFLDDFRVRDPENDSRRVRVSQPPQVHVDVR